MLLPFSEERVLMEYHMLSLVNHCHYHSLYLNGSHKIRKAYQLLTLYINLEVLRRHLKNHSNSYRYYHRMARRGWVHK